MTSPDQSKALITQLQSSLGDEHVLLDHSTRALYSQDIWRKGAVALAVVRPSTSEQVCSVIRAAAGAGVPIAPRGGGMSYTAAYTLEQPGLVLCSSRMNSVLEVNEEDLSVTVQAGCTWSNLHDVLQPTGLRTPFWGPLSGRYATVGGSLSQNSIFWGGTRHGSTADSVIALQVALASGELLNTGSAVQSNALPFFRHFGPDLTGLFCCDSGALGIKTSVTLKLIPQAARRDFLSFDFPDHRGLLATMAEISRQDLASECFGFDPLLTEMRAQRDSLMADARSLGKVMSSAKSMGQAARDAVDIVRSGRGFMQSLTWPLHVIAEEKTADALGESIGKANAIAEANGGQPVPNSIPKIMRSNPFGPVNNMIGPGGERVNTPNS